MRKTVVFVTTALLMAALTACSGSNEATGSSTSVNSEQLEADASDITAENEGSIDVGKESLDVEIAIPADFAETYGLRFESQEEAVTYAKEQGFKSVAMGDDGTVYLVMSKTRHKKVMEELNKTIDETLQKMVGAEDYPNITAVDHNDDYTEIKVTTESEELSLNESFAPLLFYLYGKIFNAFNGTSVDNIHVDFIHEVSGEVIERFDSKNQEIVNEYETEDAAKGRLNSDEFSAK